jgi:hypothetical protein
LATAMGLEPMLNGYIQKLERAERVLRSGRGIPAQAELGLQTEP